MSQGADYSRISVPSILSRRLALVSISPEAAEAIIGGDLLTAGKVLGGLVLPVDWPAELEGLLRLRLSQMREDPGIQPWLARAMVLRTPDQTVVGHCGFHGPPRRRGEVELGYTVLEPFRRHGLATEASIALMRWATETHNVRHFVASVSPTNSASLGVIRKLGFVQTGVQWDDEDGEELLFELGGQH